MIETALRNLILADDGLHELIEERLYPVYRPQGVREACIVYQQIGGSDIVTTGGFVGLVDARFQLTCFDRKHADCVILTRACLAVIKNAVAACADLSIKAVAATEPVDLPNINDQAEQLSVFARRFDCTLSYDAN